MTNQMTGGCLCGKIRYAVAHDIKNAIACHCRNCQKASGAGMSHNAVVPASAITITAGEPKRFVDTAQSGNKLYRFFCADCGSSLFSQREKTPEMMVVKVGTLDNSDDLKLVMNIWTDSARPWVYIDPAIEQHTQNRPVPKA